MSSRELVRNDKTDLILGRALKSWVGHSRLPEPGREELIQAAKLYPRIPPRWMMASALIRILIMFFKGVLAGRTPRDGLLVYACASDDPLRGSSSPFNISMLQLSILYLTSPRLCVSSFIL